MEALEPLLEKWQAILRLQDWDIHLQWVETSWRKTADIKIDAHDKKAVLLVNRNKAPDDNPEEIIVHELLHLKLWGLDQMLEALLISVFGQASDDPKHAFAYAQFMDILEPTVEDLTKAFLHLGAVNKALSFSRLQEQIEEELN